MLEHYQTDAKAAKRNAEMLQLLGIDSENSLLKYRVSYRHLTDMIETFELLIKSCEKFNFLFVYIQCSLKKMNIKV